MQACQCSECRCGQPEDDVQLPIEDQCRAGIGGPPRDEPLADEGVQRPGTALRPEAAGDDRLGDLGWIAGAEEPGVDPVEPLVLDTVHHLGEGQVQHRPRADRLGGRRHRVFANPDSAGDGRPEEVQRFDFRR